MAQTSNPLHIENSVNSLARGDLQLPKAFQTYREMLNDEIIGGGMSLIKSLINKRGYSIETPKNSSPSEKKLIQALNKSLNNLEGVNKQQLVTYILSELDYGLSIFEQVFQRVEGKMVYKTFSPIHPIDVKKYVYKRNILEELELTPSTNDGQLIQNDVAEKKLKGDKVLMFKLNADLDNPLGLSMLARCYKPWKSKAIAEEYELIGIAKNLSGIMKIKAPSEYITSYYNDPTSDQANYMEELFTQAELMHAGKSPFAVIASDTQENGVSLFDITTIGGDSKSDIDVNAIIGRYEANIFNTLFTNILTLGNNGGGSFALADSKTNILTFIIESICLGISETFKQSVKQAYLLNGVTLTGDSYPTLKWDSVEALDFEAFSRGFQRLVKDNVVQVDEPLEEWIRERIGAPHKDEKTTRTVEVKTAVASSDDNDRDEKEA